MKAFEEVFGKTTFNCPPAKYPIPARQYFTHKSVRDIGEYWWRAALERVTKQMKLNPYMDNGELRTWIGQELGEN